MPAMFEGMAPPTGMDANAQGTPGGGRDAVAQVMGQIRTLGQSIQELGQTMPAFAPEVQQMQSLLKRMITKAAQTGPQQTPGASMTPGS